MRSAQNVGKVLMSRKHNLMALIWGHVKQNFQWSGQIPKLQKIYRFAVVGQWALFTRFGIICWCHFGFHIGSSQSLS